MHYIYENNLIFSIEVILFLLVISKVLPNLIVKYQKRKKNLYCLYIDVYQKEFFVRIFTFDKNKNFIANKIHCLIK